MSRTAFRIASPALLLAVAAFVATGLTGTVDGRQADKSTMAARAHGGKVTQLPLFREDFTKPAQQQVFVARNTSAAANNITAKADHYYNQLRASLKWIDVRMGSNRLRTPDPLSRIVLARSAAERAGLHEVGLDHRDVYGIIYSETSWIPRMGASKDGTPNLGIAQFEPATAKALGLRNPHDPVEAVHVAAVHLKQAAVWSSKRLQGLKLSPAMQAAKLREGISIYYNLSTKGRNKWNGLNTAKLPIETRRHISNQRKGAVEAETIEARLREFRQHERMTAENVRSGVVKTGG